MAAKPRQAPRRSLRQSLKDLFLRRLRNPSKSAPETVGSGILRRADPSSFVLSSVTTFTSFPDVTNSPVSLEEWAISRSIPNRFQSSPSRADVRSPARQTLLPATSLSHFDLRHAYLQRSTVPSRVVHQAVSTSCTSVVSREASISTLSSLSSASTLKLRGSRKNLIGWHPQVPKVKTPPLSALVNHNRRKQVSWLQSPSVSSASVQESFSDPTRFETNEHGLEGMPLVEHFKSFCVLDTAAPGFPVVATSHELRYIFEIGEHFFLNSCECEGASMDIVTGQDAAGDPVTHLVLFSPLIIPSSGRSRYMLASLVDVTRFIHGAASLPELDKSPDNSIMESDLQTPSHDRMAPSWVASTSELSVEDLLGGCVLQEDRGIRAAYQDDIWLNLAHEAKSKSSTRSETPGSILPKFDETPKPSKSWSPPSTNSSTVDEVLEEFMGNLQELYSDFFLLGKSPLDDTYYEICNVSPTVYAARDYINGHLSHTGQQGIVAMSEGLAQGSPFSMKVKWGSKGIDKYVYCSPLYGQNSTTWICFLVDDRMPSLW
ncbi:hypothetical protein LTR47_000422 [Exophiala xenobiotica]|nr:hypothetical protein LTR41_004198 [Exophiala xenobiotica]KAK5238679.1 hypothetical protein LTR47_000422 [Exophiala xenobiotica]KAK5255599.1 hypothetical protein LTS06_000055 [Exophiala xenobiotica]KAK5262550.1 hypothetical protein LTR40_000056 [Exophiala xenobiotica]KAK5350108.1 hypothetical protein LTR61_006083 [Exophiala xenobiotica]